MRYPPELLDEIRARLPVSQVVGRRVPLKRAGRELKGLSPFKVEKTPSFYVNDQKGFYHCFASGEHGDIFTFLMKTEGLSFPEAVERCAADAGVTLPKKVEREPGAEDQRARLYALLEASATFFQAELTKPAGTEARRYLVEKRGLDRTALQAFRLGFAPASRSALKEHLAAQGFTAQELALSGMLVTGEDIAVPYDRFRNRVMFPITDMKGRVIAFGGRALEKDVPAKYLNSPETPLFHKGHILFNAHRARPIAFDKGRIVVVEGYMDVVAMTQAGVGEAVAPLGTALTEDQIQLLWRMTPEPILCFDGDSAGRKAAFRAVETVLPHLKPGHSLSFAFLPEGLDPDDLLRQQGPQAVRQVLERTRPLSDMLFEREWGLGDWSTPERRARLDQQIEAQVRRIEDNQVRQHYAQAMRERLDQAWGRTGPQPAPAAGGHGSGQRAGGWRSGGKNGAQGARRGQPNPSGPDPRTTRTSSLKSSRLVGGAPAGPSPREALILRTVLNHPWLLDEHAETLATLELSSQGLARLRDGILTLLAGDNSLDRVGMRTQLGVLGLTKVLESVDRAITHRSHRFAEPDADQVAVEAGWREVMVLHQRHVELVRALSAAEQSYRETVSEDGFARICEIKRQIAALDEVVNAPDAAVA